MRIKKQIFLFMIILISIYLFSFICSFFTTTTNTKFNITKPKKISLNWKIDNTELDELPQKITMKKGNLITLTNTLPDDISDNYILLYNSNHSSQNVYIDNKLVYSYGNKSQLPFGHITGNIECLVPLNKEDAGKIIKIEITPYYNNNFEIQTFKYGEYNNIAINTFFKDSWRIPFAVILFIISICSFLLFLSKSTEGINFDNELLLYYAGFNLAIANWIICSSDILQFVTNKNAITAFNSFINLLFACCTYSGFCKCVFNSKFFNIMKNIGYILILLNISLYVLDQKDPVDLLFLTHIYVLIVLISNIYLSTKELKTNKDAKPSLISTSFFSILIIISIISFYKHPGSGTDGIIVALGFGFLTISLLYIIISNEINIIKQSTRLQTYKKMAYEDQLTGLNNRACLEEDLKNVQNNDEVIFIMCDLNYLKQTNDNIGHEAGDLLIKNAAKCLYNTFEKIGKCYRLGGDEFAVIIINSKLTPEKLLSNLEQNINKFNKNSGSNLSLAYGYSVRQYNKSDKAFKRIIYKEADDNMYHMKSLQKEQMKHEKH